MIEFKLAFVIFLNHSVVYVAAEVVWIAGPSSMILSLFQSFHFSHSMVYWPIHRMPHVHCILLLECNGLCSSLQMGIHNRIRFDIRSVLMEHDLNYTQECLYMFVRSIHDDMDSRIEMVSSNR